MKVFKQCICHCALAFAAFCTPVSAQAADYTNPILHADYSDPDVIRAGKTYYMTASSFNNAPGLPLLQSDDMVHWRLIGHALPQLLPLAMFARPEHGKGVWAPCLRFHDGQFWIFYPDPDQGIFVTTASEFAGPWSEPRLILPGKGIIDPTPLWDDDGQAWLLHAWAKSRAGFNNVLSLRKMAPDGSRVIDDGGKVIIDGNKLAGYTTLEGPKFYKHGGYYYIFAPAGGVEHGWQSVFRSRTIDGPYEDKIVMAQGTSSTNGPHQGAWVRTPEGTDWFYHFQDKRAYGRVVHLQPMRWKNAWPVIGSDDNDSGTGEPVLHHEQPVEGELIAVAPPDSDDFNGDLLGLQWQWNANPQPAWYSLSARQHHLRLFSQYQHEATDDQWKRAAILMQKLPALRFTATTRLDAKGLADGDRAGLILYGIDYAWLGIRRDIGKAQLVLTTCHKAQAGCQEKTVFSIDMPQTDLSLRMTLDAGGVAQFAYSTDHRQFTQVAIPFTASMGRWVGARIGLFSAASREHSNGFIDVDDFRVTY